MGPVHIRRQGHQDRTLAGDGVTRNAGVADKLLGPDARRTIAMAAPRWPVALLGAAGLPSFARFA
jgi:hypothetical protein